MPIPAPPKAKSKLAFEKKDSNPEDTSSSTTKVNQTLFEQAQTILNNDCLSCHRGVVNDWGVEGSSTELEWMTLTPNKLIEPGVSAESRLLQKIVHSNGGNMPPGKTRNTYPIESYNILVMWVDSLPKRAAPNPIATPIATPIIIVPTPVATPLPTPVPTPVLSKFEQARNVLNNNCLSCHSNGSLDWGMNANSSESQWINETPNQLINSGNIRSSRVMQKMIHFTGGNMPPGADEISFPKSEFDKVGEWISSLTPVVTPVPTPVVTPVPTPVVTPVPTPVVTPVPTPVVTPVPTPVVTPVPTPVVTPVPTPVVTPVPTPIVTPVAVSLFQKAQVVLNNKCLNCHGSFASSWSVSTSSGEAEWLKNSPSGLIVPGDAAASTLVKLMIYSTGGNMPLGASTADFPQSDFDDISNWINSLEKIVTEEVVVTAGDPVFTNGEKVSLGDRNFTSKILRNIFGEESVITTHVRSQLIAFGGPCPEGHGWSGNRCLILDNVFDMGGTSHTGSKDLLHNRHYIAVDIPSSSAQVIPESSPVREGYRTFACEKILFSGIYNSDFSHPLFKAINTVKKFQALSGAQQFSPINFNNYPTQNQVYSDSELTAAYQMFHSYRRPNPSELARLRKIVTTAQSSDLSQTNGFPVRFEAWRYLLYSLCDSPSWQLK
jgi:uncharacterized membrane protein